MNCRPGCGACCIAPSISSLGKPAGLACPQLDAARRCRLFGSPDRPAVCASLAPSPEMCGDSREHAMIWIAHLELATNPWTSTA
jgi:hypothetical protein